MNNKWIANNARYSRIMRTIKFSNNSMVANEFSNDSMVCDVITRRMQTILEKGIISNEVTISTNNTIPILVTMVPCTTNGTTGNGSMDDWPSSKIRMYTPLPCFFHQYYTNTTIKKNISSSSSLSILETCIQLLCMLL